MVSLANFHPICGHGHNCAYILICKTNHSKMPSEQNMHKTGDYVEIHGNNTCLHNTDGKVIEDDLADICKTFVLSKHKAQCRNV